MNPGLWYVNLRTIPNPFTCPPYAPCTQRSDTNCFDRHCFIHTSFGLPSSIPHASPVLRTTAQSLASSLHAPLSGDDCPITGYLAPCTRYETKAIHTWQALATYDEYYVIGHVLI